MKDTFLTVIASVMVAVSLGAQTAPPHHPGTPPTPQQMIERRVQQLTTTLGLTAAQQQQATTIFTDEVTAMQALQPKMKEARDALQNAIKTTGLDADIERAAAQQGTISAQIAAVQGKAQAKFRSILTVDQKQKLDSFAGGWMGGGLRPMRGRGPLGDQF